MKYQLAVINKFHEISQPPRIEQNLSSPRAKRAGPKGLRAESARAFTGRRNSHSGRGEDFLSR